MFKKIKSYKKMCCICICQHEGQQNQHKKNHNQHSAAHCSRTAPVCLGKNGSIRTQRREKMEAEKIKQSTAMVGVLFCLPSRPFRKGYGCTVTQQAKNSFPNRGPHELYPLLMASDAPATTPTMLRVIRVVGGIRRQST